MEDKGISWPDEEADMRGDVRLFPKSFQPLAGDELDVLTVGGLEVSHRTLSASSTTLFLHSEPPPAKSHFPPDCGGLNVWADSHQRSSSGVW